mgnify:CR=1 FL=1
MRAADLDLRELLALDPKGGVIRFANERVLLVDAVALGLLRRELIDTIGLTGARAVLTRFGYAHGWRTAEALRDGFPWDSEDEWRKAGGRLHTLQGLVRVEPALPGGAATAEALIAAGLRCPISPRFRTEIWVKLIGNVAFNPISALTGATLEQMRRERVTERVRMEGLGEASRSRDVVESCAGAALAERSAIPVEEERRSRGRSDRGQARTAMCQIRLDGTSTRRSEQIGRAHV